MTDDIRTTPGEISSAAPSAVLDEDGAEPAAIIAIINALKPLSPDAQRRVVVWAASKYGVSSTTSGVAPMTAASRDRGSIASDVGREVDLESLQDFGELIDATQPEDDVERVLAACYWVQYRLKKNHFGSQDANTLLKNLGHQVGRISDVFDAIRERKPSPIIQIKKDGSHQQSRKQYRMTPAGSKLVLEATRDGAFAKLVAS